MILLVDAHVHLSDSLLSGHISEIIAYLRGSGTLALTMSVDLRSSIETIQIARKLPSHIIPFAGIHPNSAHNESLGEFEKYYNNTSDEITGIGEIGLDGSYTTEREDIGRQVKVFKAMLSIAEKEGKPVSVHSRKAVEESLEILGQFDLKGVLLHWFAGTESELTRVQDMGYMISFGPAMVYSKRLQRLAGHSNRDLTLVESDGPVRYSACFEGHPSDSRFLASVVRSLAWIWQESFSGVEDLLHKNTSKYLKSNI